MQSSHFTEVETEIPRSEMTPREAHAGSRGARTKHQVLCFFPLQQFINNNLTPIYSITILIHTHSLKTVSHAEVLYVLIFSALCIASR